MPVGSFPLAFGLGGAVARNTLPQSRRSPGQRELVGDALKMAAGPWAHTARAATAQGLSRSSRSSAKCCLKEIFLLLRRRRKNTKKKKKKGVELFCKKCRSAPRSCNFVLHQDGANPTRSLQSAGMLKGSAPRSWVLPAERQLSLFNEG